MKVLVTGCAGFIGFHVCRRLIGRGDTVIGLDNLNAYYDIGLKEARLAEIAASPAFRFVRLDLADRPKMAELFHEARLEKVVHLAAQAGVRHSLKEPYAYADSNLTGFLNIIEGCRHSEVKHLVFASSSSIYGANTHVPFSTHDNADHPLSLYAATKKANELMAHAYAHLFRLPCTGLRLFTVYGPWGRPDMALFLFTHAILAGESIHVFNEGKMKRDFTYIDDVVEGIIRVLDRTPHACGSLSKENPDPATSSAPYRIYNIGQNRPTELLELITILESKLGKRAKMIFEPMQPGDVPATFADAGDLLRDTGFTPQTPLDVGVQHFIDWYRTYYKIQDD